MHFEGKKKNNIFLHIRIAIASYLFSKYVMEFLIDFSQLNSAFHSDYAWTWLQEPPFFILTISSWLWRLLGTFAKSPQTLACCQMELTQEDVVYHPPLRFHKFPAAVFSLAQHTSIFRSDQS